MSNQAPPFPQHEGELCSRCSRDYLVKKLHGLYCPYCGVMHKDRSVITYQELPEGGYFLSDLTGDVVLCVKAEAVEMPVPRKHRNNNYYHAEDPTRQGSCGPLAWVVPCAPANQLPQP